MRKNLGRIEKRERIFSKYMVGNSHRINKKTIKSRRPVLKKIHMCVAEGDGIPVYRVSWPFCL